MPSIAVVDDRDEVRQTVADSIEMALPDKEIAPWTVLSTRPFRTLDEYLAYVTDECISVLVIDERLNEQGGGIAYSGHELAEFLRGHFPEFPIFMVTAYPPDEELEAHAVALDHILDRRDFYGAAEKWVPRFIRAGQQYFKTHAQVLAQLSELAEKAASGEISSDEETKLRSLQATVGRGFLFNESESRDDALKKLGELVAEADALREKVEKALKRKRESGADTPPPVKRGPANTGTSKKRTRG